jgi:hypothetical protein
MPLLLPLPRPPEERHRLHQQQPSPLRLPWPTMLQTAYLDLSTTNGGKHFKTGTESLTAQAFNFEDPSDLRIFLDLIKVKSQVFGWNPILSIPVTDATTGVVTHCDLLDKYGMIERSDVIAHLNTYYSTPTKQAQDSFMFCQCLIASLSIDFLKKITAESITICQRS